MARNIESKLTFNTSETKAFDAIAETIVGRNKGFAAQDKNFLSIKVRDLDSVKVNELFERHLISKELLANKKNSWIVIRKDNKVCVMLGEEDHIRIQSIHVGMALRQAFGESKGISDDIASEHKLAFRDDFGYLTSCPTNLGCAMRASVMIFLPALTLTGQIDSVIGHVMEALENDRVTVRGVYGEGSEAGGHMYQISNQACLGMSEQAIIESVEEIAIQIAKVEVEVQQEWFANDPDWIIDQVNRSWALLTNSLIMSTSEAVDHLAMIKLGTCLGIIRLKNNKVLDDLFFNIQPATLVSQKNNTVTVRERDKIRAAKISGELRALRIN